MTSVLYLLHCGQVSRADVGEASRVDVIYARRLHTRSRFSL
jgi:hypothetical protein